MNDKINVLMTLVLFCHIGFKHEPYTFCQKWNEYPVFENYKNRQSMFVYVGRLDGSHSQAFNWHVVEAE